MTRLTGQPRVRERRQASRTASSAASSNKSSTVRTAAAYRRSASERVRRGRPHCSGSVAEDGGRADDARGRAAAGGSRASTGPHPPVPLVRRASCLGCTSGSAGDGGKDRCRRPGQRRHRQGLPPRASRVVAALEVRLFERRDVVDVDLAVGRQLFVPGAATRRLHPRGRRRSPAARTAVDPGGELVLDDGVGLRVVRPPGGGEQLRDAFPLADFGGVAFVVGQVLGGRAPGAGAAGLP